MEPLSQLKLNRNNTFYFTVMSSLHAFLFEHSKLLVLLGLITFNCSFHLFFLSNCLLFFFIILTKPHFSNSSPVYLVDFSCFKPPCFCRVPFSSFLENISMFETHDKESLAFMAKILSSSGQSEETYLPPALHYIPPKTHQRESIKEFQISLFPIMDDLLAKTNLSAQDIDILIVNCSAFCPSPSLLHYNQQIFHEK